MACALRLVWPNLIALGMALATPATANTIKQIHPQFSSYAPALSQSQNQTIRGALRLVRERMFASHVLACAESHSVRALPTSLVEAKIDQVLDADAIELTIENLEQSCTRGGVNMPGWAIRGAAHVTTATDGRSVARLRVKLNYNCIGHVYESPEFWAGVIAHELGHQLGLTHKNMPSQGTYVYEWGNCVEHDGETNGL